jgi:hypothetical protein
MERKCVFKIEPTQERHRWKQGVRAIVTCFALLGAIVVMVSLLALASNGLAGVYPDLPAAVLGGGFVLVALMFLAYRLGPDPTEIRIGPLEIELVFPTGEQRTISLRSRKFRMVLVDRYVEWSNGARLPPGKGTHHLGLRLERVYDAEISQDLYEALVEAAKRVGCEFVRTQTMENQIGLSYLRIRGPKTYRAGAL